MTKQEQLKYEKVRDNLENKILFHRYDNLEELNKFLRNEFDIEADISEFSEDNVNEMGIDCALIAGINKYWGYVDIYYLIDNSNRLVITEITISEE